MIGVRRLLVAAGVAFALAGCGSDGGGEAAADPVDLGEELGCESFAEQDTEELYVRELFDCERGGETTSVYTFNTSSARDSWREIAEEFGTVVVDEGDTWLEVEP